MASIPEYLQDNPQWTIEELCDVLGCPIIEEFEDFLIRTQYDNYREFEQDYLLPKSAAQDTTPGPPAGELIDFVTHALDTSSSTSHVSNLLFLESKKDGWGAKQHYARFMLKIFVGMTGTISFVEERFSTQDLTKLAFRLLACLVLENAPGMVGEGGLADAFVFAEWPWDGELEDDAAEGSRRICEISWVEINTCGLCDGRGDAADDTDNESDVQMGVEVEEFGMAVDEE